MIYVRWDKYGWVAKDILSGQEGPHSNGPRAAAELLCVKCFPKNTWRLHFVRRGQYRVEALP